MRETRHRPTVPLVRVREKLAALLAATAACAGCAEVKPDAPDVVGQAGDDAERILQEADFNPEFKSDTVFGRDGCRVTKQSPPRKGDALDPTVTLDCEVRVPRVVGKDTIDAESKLRDVSLEPVVSYPSDARIQDCRVTSQSRRGTALPFTKVRLRQRCPKERPRKARSSGNCDPNYTGACVPRYPPDVDCDAVSGPVVVTGQDVHALDTNNDAQACEGP